MINVESLRQELHELKTSWAYAFAMGHGCSLGWHPQHEHVRNRAQQLCALIKEHEEK